MELKFTVHNPHRTKVSQTVEFRGAHAHADLDCFEAELLSSDGLSGTLKVRALGAEIADAEALFVPDAAVSATFAGVAAPQPEPAPEPAPAPASAARR